jgi:predicted P-loop ATPase
MTRALVPGPAKGPGASLPIDFVDLDRGNIPTPSMINTRVAIGLLGLDCRYDVLHDRYTVNGSAFGNSAMQVSDAVARKLRGMIRLAYKFDPGAQNAMDALYGSCEANAFNPVLDYLDTCEAKWDGTPRIDTWLTDYMGAEDTPFTRGVARLMLIASVRRARLPGCKFDYMAVLQSPEGKGKSSGLAELYGRENFSDQSILGATDKELAEALRGRWCVECSELVGLKRGEIERVKAAITRETDRVRPAYGRAVVDVPRTMVFWGTTNDDEYLRALSGENRRFLPITVGEIDIKGLARDRDQLWGEAASEEWLEGSLSLPTSLWQSASVARAGRTQDDPWADVLEHVAERAAASQQANVSDDDEPGGVTAIYEAVGDEERVSSEYVLGVALGIPQERRTPDQAKRAANVMRSLGWSKPTGGKARINGKSVRAYVRPFADPFADLM